MHASRKSGTFESWYFKNLSRQEVFSRICFLSMIIIALIIGILCVIEPLQLINKPFPGFMVNQRMLAQNWGRSHWTGIQAGLGFPDKILKANEAPVASFKDLEVAVKKVPIGAPIQYTIERKGEIVTVLVSTMLFSWFDFLETSGIQFISGLIYLLIGIGVFVAKPDKNDSWAFVLICLFLYTYAFTGIVQVPITLAKINLAAFAFIPAAFLHLSMLFPEKRMVVEKYKKIQFFPYILATLLAIPIFILYPRPSFAPLYKFILVYLVIAPLILIASILQAYFKNASVVAKQRAKIVLFGATLAFPLPALARLFSFFGITIGGIVIKGNLLAIPILLFPASIAYAIARHDLFSIDVIIRRTYGYLLSTATIVGAYAVIVLTLNVTLQGSEVARSPLFSLAFALGIVFLFEPLHKRMQSLIDRLFYRQQYDYRTTIRDISETMIRILDPEQINRTLIGSVVREMFLENGVLLLPDPANHGYHAKVVEGVEDNKVETFTAQHVNADHPLVYALQEQSDPIFAYDVELNPLYEQHRGALQHTFQSLHSNLMLPLKYKDEMRGIISLGRKKSGKMFTPEDLDLLRTLTNQSAIALENAKLFEENLEKGRMEEELKIAHDIQMSMLPERAPQIAGISIAANSIPAREVGGDFYDFIEISTNGTGKRLAVVVGDVSGKAVSGALVMAASRSVFRVLAESYASVEEIMAIGNARLNRDIKKGMFVALLYAVLDPQRKVLTLSNAGQTQPIICRQDQSAPAYIETEGDRFPLGIVRRCKYLETHVPLQPGDTLVFYTDGVVEAMNDKAELYGFERFMASIAAGRALGAEVLLAKLMDDVSGYVGDAEPHDDLTIVVVRVE